MALGFFGAFLVVGLFFMFDIKRFFKRLTAHKETYSNLPLETRLWERFFCASSRRD